LNRIKITSSKNHTIMPLFIFKMSSFLNKAKNWFKKS
jgi:hypothetical protein